MIEYFANGTVLFTDDIDITRTRTLPAGVTSTEIEMAAGEFFPPPLDLPASEELA